MLQPAPRFELVRIFGGTIAGIALNTTIVLSLAHAVGATEAAIALPPFETISAEAELPAPPECIEDLNKFGFCIGEPWVPAEEGAEFGVPAIAPSSKPECGEACPTGNFSQPER